MSSREPCFTKVPNNILEFVVSINITAREFRVIFSILRLTVGYHKECEEISLGKIAKLTEMDKSTVSLTLNSLINRKIITETSKPDYQKGRIISVNPNTEEWILKVSTVDKISTPTVDKSSTPTVVKKTTPSYYIKENIKKITKESRKVNENFSTKKSSYDIELFKEMLNRAD